jgi:hypothetical protein
MTSHAIHAPRRRYLELSRLGAPEYILCIAGPVLLAAMFLPWFQTAGSGGITGHSGAVSAWVAYPASINGYLVWLGIGSFILPWIVARGHALSWREGEMTMVFAITGVVLIVTDGVLTRPGQPDSLIHLGIGYPLGLLAAVAITYAGWRRQATLTPANAHRVSRIWNDR